MSAILSGKCKKCFGKYYISLGHPKWFDDRMKHNKDNAIYDRFEKLRSTGLCPECGKNHYARFASEWKKAASQEVGDSNGHRIRQRHKQ